MGFFDKIKSALGGASEIDEAPVASHAYAYPKKDEALLQAYGGRYQACYIILHPFHIYDESNYEEGDVEFLSWQQVIEQTNIKTIKQLNLALLTDAAIQDEPDEEKNLATDEAALDSAFALLELQKFIEGDEFLEYPDEGRFDEYYSAQHIAMFKSFGYEQVAIVPQFPTDEILELDSDLSKIKKFNPKRETLDKLLDEARLASFDDLAKITEDENKGFAETGTVLSLDAEILLTVDVDSFFTLLYSTERNIEKIIRDCRFEGFFADKNTKHNWSEA